MLFRIETDLHISDLLKLTNDVASRMSQFKVATSYVVVPCREKETGEKYDDKLYFIEIPTLDKLMEIINNMNDFTFTITPGIESPLNEWDFELVMGEEEERLYRYPILWIN